MDFLKREYVIKSDQGFLGPGGWTEMSKARRYGAEDAIALLSVHPGSTAIAITSRGADRRVKNSIVRSGHDRRHEEAVTSEVQG